MARAVVIVLDGVGCGAAPDAGRFGDAGSDTLGNTARACGGLSLPHLGRLGLGNLHPVLGVPPADAPAAAWGRMAPASAAKDTMTGHWELMGLVSSVGVRTYPDGFPPEVMARFEAAIGRPALGNRAASGTVILDELGPEHVRTGRPIVYTSADSVFQIAAHEEVVPVETLYAWCEAARRILTGPHSVGRVIARPFVGPGPGRYVRTPRRRDWALEPPGPTALDSVLASGQETVGVGKIHDIFAGRGLSRWLKGATNAENVALTRRAMAEVEQGLILTNLVDFDTLWGHRNNPRGLGDALEAFDAEVPGLLAGLRPGDALLLTADHGNDPTTPSTDHSREVVPLLVAGPAVRPGVPLGTRASFADLGATVAEMLGAEPPPAGTSFWRDVAR